MLKISRLNYTYTKEQVLSDINLTIGAGELFCILGPNGCGKTTLLKCLAGILTTDDGTIELHGSDLRQMSHKERAKDMSYVPQSAGQILPYSVEDIVLMGRTPYINSFRMPGKKDLHLVDKVLVQMGIHHLKHRLFNTLSGGEAQLVKLARGLVQQAYIHLLDEPTAALDLKNELQLLENIRDLVHQQSHTIVMTTHYPNQALYFENHGIKTQVCMIKSGTVRYVGKPSEVINHQRLKELYGVDTLIQHYEMPEGEKGIYIIPHKADY